MAPPRAVSTLYPMWQDADGAQAATGYTLLDQSDVPYGPYSSLLAAALNISVAKHAFVSFNLRAAGAGSTGTGPYQSILDSAEFAVKSANYVKVLSIRAPDDSIFLPGTDLVDMSDSRVQAFITQVQTVLGDSYGSPWTAVAQGIRRRVGQR